MLSGVMLIIVTMFAVLGAYYLSDLLTNCLFRRRKAAEALVVLRADTSEQMWAGVLDARAALPDTAVVVLCPQEDAFTPPGAGMRGGGLRYAGHIGASGAGPAYGAGITHRAAPA